MTFVNLLSSDSEHWVEMGEISEAVITEVLRSLVLLITPLAPFLSAELWEKLGYEGVVFRQPWPESDPELAKEDKLEIPVQINGKLVTVVHVAVDADSKSLEAAALADEKVQARISGKTVVKVIVVPRKLVNLVVR
jgi:leucyl-tRNA synthetase